MMYDPGLQPERTDLAWRRTALSIVVGGLVGLRLLPSVLGSGGAVLAGVGTVAGLACGLLAARRSRRTLAFLRHGEGELPDGRLNLALVVITAGGATVTLVAAFIWLAR